MRRLLAPIRIQHRTLAQRISPFNERCNCPGCGAAFQSTQDGNPGFIPPELLPRLAMVQRPAGFAPVLATSPSTPDYRKALPDGLVKGYTRLELERLNKRFGNSEHVSKRPAEEPKPVEADPEYKDFVCARCHTLSNYGKGIPLDYLPSQVAELKLRPEDANLLKMMVKPDTLLVNIVDLMDLPYSLAGSGIYDLIPNAFKLPTILVGNKIDLMPGHGKTTVEQATACLASLAKDMKVIGIHMVSARTGFGMDKLMAAVMRYAIQSKEHVLLAGRTNVGKSVLYNSFRTEGPEKECVLSTVSHAHGTTIGVLRKKLCNIVGPWKAPRHLWLFDTPGFYLPDRHLENSYLRPDELENIVVDSSIVPKKHKLGPGDTGLIAGLCRIDVDSELPFQLFMRPSLPYFKKSTKIVDKFLSEWRGVAQDPPPSLAPPLLAEDDPRRQVPYSECLRFEVSAIGEDSVQSDVVFGGGLGWIAFGRPQSGSCTVTISTPGGIGAKLRTPIRTNFL